MQISLSLVPECWQVPMSRLFQGSANQAEGLKPNQKRIEELGNSMEIQAVISKGVEKNRKGENRP